jgi:hypothetical protein
MLYHQNPNFKFMDEKTIAEMNELLSGEHKEALTAFAFECGNAGVCGYKQGCVERGLIAAGSGLLIFGAVKIGKKIINKCKQKKLNKTKNVLKKTHKPK